MKCVHVDAEGFCGNKKLQGGGFKCCHCGAFTPDKQSIMKNNKSTVVEAEVVEVSPRGAAETEETRAVAPSPRGAAETFGARLAPPEMNRDGIVKTIARQIEAVRGAELRSTFEKLKLGAMVKQAVTLLGLEGRGNSHRGDGVKGWWDENFKGEDGQPVIAYKTLMMWISAAEKLSEKMAVGGGKSEAIMCTLAKDPANVVGKEAKILKSAEKVANGMTMRQMLLWGDDEEARRPGRPKGSGKPTPENYAAAHKEPWENAATAYALVWGELDKKRQLPNLASLLKVEDARDILALVEPVYHALKKRVGEVKG